MTQPIPRDEATRWRVVTILRGAEDVGLPEPLARLGDAIEVKLTEAPGDRGTELWARLRSGDGDLTPDDVRKALRRSKQLLEAGEVAVVQPNAHGHRRRTPQGALLDIVASVSEGKGIL